MSASHLLGLQVLANGPSSTGSDSPKEAGGHMMTKSHDIDDEHSVSARLFVRPMLPCLTDCELCFHTIFPVLIVLYDDLHTYESSILFRKVFTFVQFGIQSLLNELVQI